MAGPDAVPLASRRAGSHRGTHEIASVDFFSHVCPWIILVLPVFSFSIRTIGSDSPFASGTSISSTSRYPRALYKATPVSVAPISNFWKPAAKAADSQASSTFVPMPAAADQFGMDEKGSDFCGVGGRIEERVFAAGAVVGSEQGFALAPASAGDDGSFDFGNEIGLVLD